MPISKKAKAGGVLAAGGVITAGIGPALTAFGSSTAGSAVSGAVIGNTTAASAALAVKIGSIPTLFGASAWWGASATTALVGGTIVPAVGLALLAAPMIAGGFYEAIERSTEFYKSSTMPRPLKALLIGITFLPNIAAGVIRTAGNMLTLKGYTGAYKASKKQVKGEIAHQKISGLLGPLVPKPIDHVIGACLIGPFSGIVGAIENCVISTAEQLKEHQWVDTNPTRWKRWGLTALRCLWGVGKFLAGLVALPLFIAQGACEGIYRGALKGSMAAYDTADKIKNGGLEPFPVGVLGNLILHRQPSSPDASLTHLAKPAAALPTIKITQNISARFPNTQANQRGAGAVEMGWSKWGHETKYDALDKAGKIAEKTAIATIEREEQRKEAYAKRPGRR